MIKKYFRPTYIPAALATLLSFGSSQAFAAVYNNAAQWQQIGWAPSYTISINGKVQTLTPKGTGITVGVIDTGGTSGWVGNVPGSTVIGNCMIAGCKSSADDNGHGTFVASEISSNIPSVGMTGLANGSRVLAVKVLNSAGSGNSTDVANGIISAVNGGAQIINLSLGPSGSGAGQAGFYTSIASAVNYAASKGAFIVFAGGNNHQALAGGTRITGFTDAAISRMLFVGSVNSANNLSSYSNTPGTASFLSTTNKSYAYNKMWIMADGDNLWGASNYYTPQYGYGYVTQMSGTSMAAPQAAASLALLESQWAILRTKGTAVALLTATAKDLGTKGVDATYGTGLINLTQAMQPYGALTVNKSNGQSVALSSVTGKVILGGAFGAVSGGKISTALQTSLSNYTTFDGFGRNYLVNLSSLVSGAPSVSQASSNITAPKTKTSTTKFADGTMLSFGSVESDGYDRTRPEDASGNPSWFTSFTDAAGSTISAGSGFSASASFAGAMWGSDDAAAGQIAELAASSTLANLAQGGAFFAYGTNIGDGTRLAFSWSETQKADALSGADSSASSAMSFNSGVMQRLGKHWKGGITFGMLDQQNGMLDATYTGNDLSLGKNHQSMSFGATTSYALSPTQDIVFDAALIRTNGASMTDGFITGVSATYAQSFGASYVQRDAMEQGDRLNVSLKAPLRVTSGSVSLVTSSIDAEGLPVISTQNIAMAPSGQELDIGLGYQSPVKEGASWNLSVEGRKDAGNVAGVYDASLLIGTRLSF